MRKLWIALAAAAVTALAVAGVASAVNTYEVNLADATNGKGSLKKPIPASLDFGYSVGDTENLRPQVIRQYRIAEVHVRAGNQPGRDGSVPAQLRMPEGIRRGRHDSQRSGCAERSVAEAHVRREADADQHLERRSALPVGRAPGQAARRHGDPHRHVPARRLTLPDPGA